MAVRNRQGDLYRLAASYSRALDDANELAVGQLLDAWTRAADGIQVQTDTLIAKIRAARAAGTIPSPAWLYQEGRLRSILAIAESEVARFAEQAAAATAQAQIDAAALAMAHAPELVGQAVSPGGALTAGFMPTSATSEANLRSLAGFLSDGTPLDELVNRLPGAAAENLRTALIRGIALGHGPDVMARAASAAAGLARTRAETIVRTEALRAYRYTSSTVYQGASDALEGWVWTASKDSRCCVACVVMDGSIHPLDEILDGHPRCRCAMVPATDRSFRLPGSEWLTAQPASTQLGLMGPAKYSAWKSGSIGLDDLVARADNSRWGTMRRERSLIEIVQGRNANDSIERLTR